MHSRHASRPTRGIPYLGNRVPGVLAKVVIVRTETAFEPSMSSLAGMKHESRAAG
jgi:hypothetical protein